MENTEKDGPLPRPQGRTAFNTDSNGNFYCVTWEDLQRTRKPDPLEILKQIPSLLNFHLPELGKANRTTHISQTEFKELEILNFDGYKRGDDAHGFN